MNLNYKKCSSTVLLFFLIFGYGFLFAQQRITGTITSAKDGQPLIGVGVSEKGVKNNTTTNLDGKYAITVTGNNNLVFSYLGFKSKELKPVGTTLNVVLEEDVNKLSEVVVVGYGTQKRSDVTGAVASIPKER